MERYCALKKTSLECTYIGIFYLNTLNITPEKGNGYVLFVLFHQLSSDLGKSLSMIGHSLCSLL